MEYSFTGYVFIVVLSAGGYYIISKTMVWSQNPKYFFEVWKIEMKVLPARIRNRIWNKYILLWWDGLSIRKDRSHRSFKKDSRAATEMNGIEEVEKYIRIIETRKILHDKKYSN